MAISRLRMENLSRQTMPLYDGSVWAVTEFLVVMHELEIWVNRDDRVKFQGDLMGKGSMGG
jgi:hypothetical protein